MPATYRYEVRASRTDGSYAVVQRSAAVYETPEDALMQAAADELASPNVHPLDIVEGAHHGYFVTAFGEPANNPSDQATLDAVEAWTEPVKLAGRSHITKASRIVRELWTSPNDRRAIAADEAELPPIEPTRVAAHQKRGLTAGYAHTAARTEVTLERLREVLA